MSHLSSQHCVSSGCSVPFPWAWCNLFRNPFGELTRQERAELAVVDAADAARQLQQRYTALQFLGECGHGKTTRLLALLRECPDAAYVYLAEDQPCAAIPEASPLLIDEAQRLPRRVLKCILASGLPLVLATHRDLSRVLNRFGYQVCTTRLGHTNDAQLILEAFNRRILASRRGPGPVPRLTPEEANVLVSRFGTNVRAIEAYLYDQVQQQAHSHGEMRFID